MANIPATGYHYNESDENTKKTREFVEQLGPLIPLLAQNLYPLPEGVDPPKSSPIMNGVNVNEKENENVTAKEAEVTKPNEVQAEQRTKRRRRKRHAPYKKTRGRKPKLKIEPKADDSDKPVQERIECSYDENIKLAAQEAEMMLDALEIKLTHKEMRQLDNRVLKKIALEEYYRKWKKLLSDFYRGITSQTMTFKDVPWPVYDRITSPEDFEKILGIKCIRQRLPYSQISSLSLPEIEVLCEFFKESDPIKNYAFCDRYGDHLEFHYLVWHPNTITALLFARIVPEEFSSVYAAYSRIHKCIYSEDRLGFDSRCKKV